MCRSGAFSASPGNVRTACKRRPALTITAYDHESKLVGEDAKDGSHHRATSGMIAGPFAS